MLGLVTPMPYLGAVLLAVALGVALCVGARLKPGRWTLVAARLIALVLLADAISFVVTELWAGTWSPKTDLPFALCDIAILVAAQRAGGKDLFSSSSRTSGAWPVPCRPSSLLTSTPVFPTWSSSSTSSATSALSSPPSISS